MARKIKQPPVETPWANYTPEGAASAEASAPPPAPPADPPEPTAAERLAAAQADLAEIVTAYEAAVAATVKASDRKAWLEEEFATVQKTLPATIELVVRERNLAAEIAALEPEIRRLSEVETSLLEKQDRAEAKVGRTQADALVAEQGVAAAALHALVAKFKQEATAAWRAIVDRRAEIARLDPTRANVAAKIASPWAYTTQGELSGAPHAGGGAFDQPDAFHLDVARAVAMYLRHQRDDARAEQRAEKDRQLAENGFAKQAEDAAKSQGYWSEETLTWMQPTPEDKFEERRIEFAIEQRARRTNPPADYNPLENPFANK